MKIDSSTDFLDGSKNSCENAESLKESANNLYQGTNKHIALFLLYTSCEELEKAIFCLLVHYGHLKHEQINPIFKSHKLKIILYEKIFNDKTFRFENGEFVLDGKLLKNIDLKKLEQQNDVLWQKYKQEREGCLYVEPEGKNWYYPKSIADVEERWNRTNKKWHGRYAFYKFLNNSRFDDDLANVSLIVQIKDDDTFIFNGTGRAMK